ncbi:aldose 1-epimerase family protein [Novosphingobium sp.]|uniref:aldose 1-epimerase family protein n=1 Tax=Novosphingobium sp. TaxID=1874826 RepID=UPI002618B85C|nr:aldose 1-epimerase family protein [Novosphingobium sp.]
MTDLVTIASEGLSARINPFGAELSSLTDAAGREYMTDADPAFWSGRAPLLFPIVGALADDTLRSGGQSYRMPKHGFARRSAFGLKEHSADRVVFRLEESAETRSCYPFAFALDMAFMLSGMTLEMIATVHNTGGEPLPFSFGYHPAFAWPLPGSADKAAHRILFEADEPRPIRQLDMASGLIAPGGAPTPVKGREISLDPELFRHDALIWTELASRRLSYGAESGAWLDVAFPDSPMLGIWQVPGARYICIEPWQGHADPLGFSGDFGEKPGVVVLPEGESCSFRMEVTVRPA